MTRTTFIAAMRATVSGVHVVTTDGAGGRLGLTVSSTASVSADPPKLLICIDSRSPVVSAIQAHGVFAVNSLHAHQAAVADTFAGRPPVGEPYDFACASWEPGRTGAPVLVGSTARFECHVASTMQAGSHTVVIGDVVAALRSSVRALAYTRRSYARPVALRV